MHRFACMIALLALLVGCGGTASSPSAGSNPTTNSTPGNAPPPTITPVTVAAGQSLANVDVTVPPPAGAAPPNVLDLGAGNLCGAMNACNTGDVVHRGSTAVVLMFGPGLTAAMQISVNGPNDITFGTPVAINSTSGTPGLQVSAKVGSGAALGARTVVLRAADGDITTFTGGLEVVP